MSGPAGAGTTSWERLQQTTPSVDPLTSAYTSTTSSARCVPDKRAPTHNTLAPAPASGLTEAAVSSTSPLTTAQETSGYDMSSTQVPLSSLPAHRERAPAVHTVHVRVTSTRTVASPVAKPEQIRAGQSEGRNETSHLGSDHGNSSYLDSVEQSAVQDSRSAVSEAGKVVRLVMNHRTSTEEPSCPHAGPAVGNTVGPAAASLISSQAVPPTKAAAADPAALTSPAAAKVSSATNSSVKQAGSTETVGSQGRAAVPEATASCTTSDVVHEHSKASADAARPVGNTHGPDTKGASAAIGEGHMPVVAPLGSAALGDPDRVADAGRAVDAREAGSVSLAHAGAARAAACSDLGVLVRPWDAVGGLHAGSPCLLCV